MIPPWAAYSVLTPLVSVMMMSFTFRSFFTSSFTNSARSRLLQWAMPSTFSAGFFTSAAMASTMLRSAFWMPLACPSWMIVPWSVAPINGLMFSADATSAFTPLKRPFFLRLSRDSRTKYVCIFRIKASTAFTTASKSIPDSSHSWIFCAILVSPMDAEQELNTCTFPSGWSSR